MVCVWGGVLSVQKTHCKLRRRKWKMRRNEYWVKLLNRDVAVKWAREEIEGKWKNWVEMQGNLTEKVSSVINLWGSVPHILWEKAINNFLVCLNLFGVWAGAVMLRIPVSIIQLIIHKTDSVIRQQSHRTHSPAQARTYRWPTFTRTVLFICQCPDQRHLSLTDPLMFHTATERSRSLTLKVCMCLLFQPSFTQTTEEFSTAAWNKAWLKWCGHFKSSVKTFLYKGTEMQKGFLQIYNTVMKISF